MADPINYEDNLFFAVAQMHRLTALFKLNIDVNTFSKYVYDQIVFFDDTLANLQESLFNNPKLIKLYEYLHSLRRAEQAFLALIEGISQAPTSFKNKLYTDLNGKVDEMVAKRQAGIEAIAVRLKNGAENYRGPDETISEEEMLILLSDKEPL